MNATERAALRERVRLSAPWDVPLAVNEVLDLLASADRLAVLQQRIDRQLDPPQRSATPTQGARL